MIKINAVKFKADQKLENFITEKVNKTIHTLHGVTGVDITLKLEKNDAHENKIVDVQVKIPGNDLFASKNAKSFEEDAMLTLDAIHQQIDKLKTKQQK